MTEIWLKYLFHYNEKKEIQTEQSSYYLGHKRA